MQPSKPPDIPVYHTHFTMIPNVADDEPMDAYARSLLWHLVRVIGHGEGGVCWQSTTTLARICGMSRGRICAAKRTLVAHDFIHIEKQPGPGGLHDVITLKDSWARNAAHFSDGAGPAPKRSRGRRMSRRETESEGPGIHAVDAGVRAGNAVRSAGEPKKIPERKTPERTHHGGSGSPCRHTTMAARNGLAGEDSQGAGLRETSRDMPQEGQVDSISVRWQLVREALEQRMARSTYLRWFHGMRCMGIDDLTHTWRLRPAGSVAVEALAAPNLQIPLRRGFAAAGEGAVTVVWEPGEPQNGD
jgi:hypothetical protein